MNRYSLIFALLVASSFAVHPTQSGDAVAPVGGASASEGNLAKVGHAKFGAANVNASASKKGENSPEEPLTQEAVTFINGFTSKTVKWTGPDRSLQILFATVPHPVETHLASAFDHNVDALQDGLQEAGYLFDSAWIPWSVHKARDGFDDDEKEKKATEEEDDTPGVLLFRGPGSFGPEDPTDPYVNGLVVFLISEKPTEGIAYPQAQKAVEILQGGHIPFSGRIRILGPTYSGSFPSLVQMVKFLSARNPTATLWIRSGTATSGDDAAGVVDSLTRNLPGIKVDFGSAHHDFSDSVRVAESTLIQMGINTQEVAFLIEDESSFGYNGGWLLDLYNKLTPYKHYEWKIYFPRDISSLRAGYEKQGIFDFSSPTQPWKKYLNLKSDEQSEGDTVPAFGGTTTIAAKEAMLFGISEFLKVHCIRAAIISATNEEDRLFLTQFLHANNPGVRVVVIGTTRIFMRGSTAQFRGDLMVDDFPMLPRLHDWTGEYDDRTKRIFADDEAQGTYFAAIDLFGKPRETDHLFKWYPEYSEPNWNGSGEHAQRPPMYIVALGGDSTWPVSEIGGVPWGGAFDQGRLRVQFPFTLFKHDGATTSEMAPDSPPIPVELYWLILFLSLASLTSLYCLFICYANPVCHDSFASFQPSETWEFWLFKVTVPAVMAGCAFWVMAWTVAIPASASSEAVWWWRASEWAMGLAPLAIVLSAVAKAVFSSRQRRSDGAVVVSRSNSPVRFERRGMVVSSLVKSQAPAPALIPGRIESWVIGWMTISFLAGSLVFLLAWIVRICLIGPVKSLDIGSILNTYREMHWESGLSLVPTGLFFLFAFLVWASQAGNGASVLNGASPLPSYPGNRRISQDGADNLQSLGRPLPFNRRAKWLCVTWVLAVAVIACAHFLFSPYLEITTLESSGTTSMVRGVAGILVALILFDVLQFLWFWDGLRGLLGALDREQFRRSFVVIHDFDWRSLWSFTGVSLQSRRAINTALIDCLHDLATKQGFTGLAPSAAILEAKRTKFNTVRLGKVSMVEYADDRRTLFHNLKTAGDELAKWVADSDHAEGPIKLSPKVEAIQRALACQSKGDAGRFSDEEEELARLPEKQQAAERFLCLMYIGFIQTVVARLHTLLFSVASTFSLVILGIMIYPFVPFSPLLVSGLALLALIAWAFFKVFSQMDRDPILSRIVNGDDRKLQGNFYFKFAEAMALPILTIGTSLLPGGAGRLLELAQTFLSQGH